MIPAGLRRHAVRLFTLGPPVPDGDGGYLQAAAPLVPGEAWAQIEPATAARMARAFGGTVVTTATLIVTIPYHPGVTTGCVLEYAGRTLGIVGVATPGERRITSVLACSEVIG